MIQSRKYINTICIWRLKYSRNGLNDPKNLFLSLTWQKKLTRDPQAAFIKQRWPHDQLEVDCEVIFPWKIPLRRHDLFFFATSGLRNDFWGHFNHSDYFLFFKYIWYLCIFYSVSWILAKKISIYQCESKKIWLHFLLKKKILWAMCHYVKNIHHFVVPFYLFY